MYQIETGIPLPRGPGRRWARKYPWHEVEVGQSFLVTDTPAKTVQCSCSLAGKRQGRKYIARVVKGGVRVRGAPGRKPVTITVKLPQRKPIKISLVNTAKTGGQQQRPSFDERLDQLIADGESMESAKRKMQREGYNIQAMR